MLELETLFLNNLSGGAKYLGGFLSSESNREELFFLHEIREGTGRAVRNRWEAGSFSTLRIPTRLLSTHLTHHHCLPTFFFSKTHQESREKQWDWTLLCPLSSPLLSYPSAPHLPLISDVSVSPHRHKNVSGSSPLRYTSTQFWNDAQTPFFKKILCSIFLRSIRNLDR